MSHALSLVAILVLAAIFALSNAGGLSETYRLEEREKRYGAEWPPSKYVPDTPGWKKLMDERLRQVAEIEDLNRRYEGYMQVSVEQDEFLDVLQHFHVSLAHQFAIPSLFPRRSHPPW